MHITQTQLEQRSSHASQSRHNVSENLRAWIGDQRPDFSDGSQGAQPRVNISSAALDALKQDQAKDNAAKSAKEASGQSASSVSSGIDLSDDENLDPRLRILKAVVEMLTGETIHLVGTRELGDLKAAALPPSAQAAASQAPPPEQAAPKQGYGVEYDYSESVYESETTSFSAQGTVRTADGQEINFSANLTMSREFQATYNARLRLGDAKLRDPLVLNFNGQAAQLSDLRIDFDLYGDGQKGSLPFVSSGSGFLVFDRNGDGKVNDGRELFGPSTGDGFTELAALGYRRQRLDRRGRPGLRAPRHLDPGARRPGVQNPGRARDRRPVGDRPGHPVFPQGQEQSAPGPDPGHRRVFARVGSGWHNSTG